MLGIFRVGQTGTIVALRARHKPRLGNGLYVGGIETGSSFQEALFFLIVAVNIVSSMQQVARCFEMQRVHYLVKLLSR